MSGSGVYSSSYAASDDEPAAKELARNLCMNATLENLSEQLEVPPEMEAIADAIAGMFDESISSAVRDVAIQTLR